MNDVSYIVRSLDENGECVEVICDHRGWAIKYDGQIVYHALDGRHLLAFLGGLVSRYIK